jgi:hypothetical protein
VPADGHCAVRHEHVGGAPVDLAEDRHALDAELAQVRMTRTAISPRLATRTRRIARLDMARI